ncbi:unnamed protein product, partial [Prorocentrum cordatum]
PFWLKSRSSGARGRGLGAWEAFLGAVATVGCTAACETAERPGCEAGGSLWPARRARRAAAQQAASGRLSAAPSRISGLEATIDASRARVAAEEARHVAAAAQAVRLAEDEGDIAEPNAALAGELVARMALAAPILEGVLAGEPDGAGKAVRTLRKARRNTGLHCAAAPAAAISLAELPQLNRWQRLGGSRHGGSRRRLGSRRGCRAAAPPLHRRQPEAESEERKDMEGSVESECDELEDTGGSPEGAPCGGALGGEACHTGAGVGGSSEEKKDREDEVDSECEAQEDTGGRPEVAQGVEAASGGTCHIGSDEGNRCEDRKNGEDEVDSERGAECHVLEDAGGFPEGALGGGALGGETCHIGTDADDSSEERKDRVDEVDSECDALEDTGGLPETAQGVEASGGVTYHIGSDVGNSCVDWKGGEDEVDSERGVLEDTGCRPVSELEATPVVEASA